MPPRRSLGVLVDASRMYYLEGKSQGDIAKALGISRSSVSRILADARERGIIEIRIRADGSLVRRQDLEAAITDLTGVPDVRVVERPVGRTPVQVVGEATARLVEEKELLQLARLGLSWGRTVAVLVDQVLVEPIHRQLHLYPLVGGMPTTDTGPSGNEAIEKLARKAGARVHRFESPAIVESRVTWAALMRETSIQSAIDDAARVQAAVVGIGSVGVHANPHLLRAMDLTEEEQRQVDRQQAAGDICGRFYDVKGRPLGPPTSERVIGLTLEQLGGIPRVIGMVAGRDKARGTVGALRTGILDTLVLDDELAVEAVRLLKST